MKRSVLILGLLATTSSALAETTVAVVPPAYTSPFYNTVLDGVKAHANKLGYKLQTQAPTKENDFAGQVNILEQLIQRKVDAITVAPINPAAITGAVKKANTAKIPMFVYNSLTPLEDNKANVTQYVGYDQWKAGELAGAYVAEKLNGKGKVYILAGIPGFHSNRRVGGFRNELKKHPGIQIVGEQAADWEREKGTNVATAALQKNPDINYFFGASDEMAIGASIAGRRLGKDVGSIGIDGNTVTLDLIAKGDVDATVGVYPKKMGEVAVQNIQKVLAGQKVPQFMETPSIVVDKSNLEAYKTEKTWTGAVAGKAERDTGKP